MWSGAACCCLGFWACLARYPIGFEEAPIRDFIPLFVERGAKHRLRQLVD
ncbi:three-helix bundle dimerization domain-containing protein [Kribbella sp. VKM Ac-2568]